MNTQAVGAVRKQRTPHSSQRHLKAAQAGDGRALEALMLSLSPSIEAWLLRRFCRDRDSTQCVLQDAWIGAWQRIGHFRDRGHLRQWLFRVARNCAIDRLRKESSGFAAFTVLSREMRTVLLAGRSDCASDHIEPDAGLAQILRPLPRRQRTALFLRYARGMTIAQIAEMLCCKPGAAKTLLWRARKTLADLHGSA